MGVSTQIKFNRVVYEDDSTGFKVVAVNLPPDSPIPLNKYGNISLVGHNIPSLSEGIVYNVELEPIKSSKYSDTYELVDFDNYIPETPNEQWSYLSSIVTLNQYNEIASVYGPDELIIDIIEKGEFEYDKVGGFGEHTYGVLRKKISGTRHLSKLIGFFGSDVTIHAMELMLQKFGTAENVINMFNKNPYSFTKIDGFGFLTVDKLALSKGVEKTDKFRILSGIHYAINEEVIGFGNTYVDYKQVLNKTQSLLGIDSSLIAMLLDSPKDLQDFDVLATTDKRYTTARSYKAEKYIAQQLIARKNVDSTRVDIDLFGLIEEYENKTGFKLSKEQSAFILSLNESNLLYLVGPAGTGKTATQDIVVQYAKQSGLNILLIAPTGRAGKQLSNKTGLPASTIHRAIYRNGEPIQRNEDIVIVDESSMVDIYLLKDLLYSFSSSLNTKFIFIGDDAQIPSVGSGNFLYDSIHSGVLDINKLNVVFRQDEGGILDVVTMTRQGKHFISRKSNTLLKFGNNCVFDFRQSTADNKYIRRILKQYKTLVFEEHVPLEEIVVLTPTNKGKYGTVATNNAIQHIINPPTHTSVQTKEDKQGRVFREGDYILITKNSYNIPVIDQITKEKTGSSDIFNGETGYITEINLKDKEVFVRIDGSLYAMPLNDVGTHIIHGYAVTIHKSQGMEYEYAIVLCDRAHTYQLNRNLLYTGFSRAKKQLWVLGDPMTFNNAIDKSENLSRKTLLKEFLQKEDEEKEKKGILV